MDSVPKVHLMKKIGNNFYWVLFCLFFFCFVLVLFFFWGGGGGGSVWLLETTNGEAGLHCRVFLVFSQILWGRSSGYFCNLGQKFCRLFHVLAQFLCTTSETEEDYYHQKVNVRVASWVVEQPKKDLRKFRNFRKIREMLEFDEEFRKSIKKKR